MATGTAPKTYALEEVIDDRWTSITSNVRKFEGEFAPSVVNSGAMERIMDDLRSIAVRMVREIHGADQERLLERAEFDVLDFMEKRIKKLAIEVEAARRL